MVDWTDTSSPEKDTTGRETSTIPVEGQVVSWLKRTENGGIVVGNVFRPGDYAIIRHSHEGLDPDQMIGTQVKMDSVGSIHVTDQGGLTHAVPRESGVYLLIKTEPEHKRP